MNLEEELRDGRYRLYLQKHMHVLEALRARIQEPPPGPYCHEDLQWKNVDGGYLVTLDPGLKVEDSSSAKRVAYIPWLRVPDFVSGEEKKRHDVETLFRCTKRDCQNVGDMKDTMRWNSIFESARYVAHCTLPLHFVRTLPFLHTRTSSEVSLYITLLSL